MWVVAGSPGMTGAAPPDHPGRAAGRCRLRPPVAPRASTDDPGRPDRGRRRRRCPPTGWADEVLDGRGAVPVRSRSARGSARADDAAEVRRARRRRAPSRWWSTATPSPRSGRVAADVLSGADRGATVLDPPRRRARPAGGPTPGPRPASASPAALAAAPAPSCSGRAPTTVVAAPDGATLLSTTGDARLATAGTGDVLTGMHRRAAGPGLPAAARRRPPAPTSTVGPAP